MEQLRSFLDMLGERLTKVAVKDAVVSKPLGSGTRQALVLSDVGIGFGGGFGEGQDTGNGRAKGKGLGGGGGGGAMARPVAVLVVEDGEVRLEQVDN